MESSVKTNESSNQNGFQTEALAELLVWPDIIPAGEWAIYQEAIGAARQAGVPFLLGGAFGLAAYTRHWRNTKDIDFFVHPDDRQRLIDALHHARFVDYYACLPYDRSWIYRATKNGVIVDVIWTVPNHRLVVDDEWFDHAQTLTIRGEQVRSVPPEELLWIKLFVMQRDRCDWPDLINLLCAVGPELDWPRLVARVGEDVPLLHAILVLFNWVCPRRARELPPEVRKRFGLSDIAHEHCDALERERVGLLDSRPWYAAFQPENQPMKL